MVNFVELLGCIAGVLTSFAFFPQILKLLILKKSIGISIFSYFCSFIGSLLWFIYGVYLSSFALVFFNLVNVINAIIIITLSYKYSKLIN
tara:strand:- start:106 stop:375 length:270 start_codon:yes stop_codon:yes gene_type:complete